MNKQKIIAYLKSKKETFKEQYGIIDIGLYGSYARDEATKDSDVDIFYSTNEKFSMGFLEFDSFIDKIKKELHIQKIDFVNLDSMQPIIKHYAKQDFIYV